MQPVVLSLSVLGCRVVVICADDRTQTLLIAGYGHMAVVASGDANLSYTAGLCPDGRRFFIDRGGERLEADSVYDFLYTFEKDLTLALQGQRPDLYFIHAAAVETEGSAVLLVAPSGTGKSTTAYGLLHEGFRYLSDELAPVDLQTMAVQPYPHALCLKSAPPAPYRLPAGTLRTNITLHVPVTALPSATCRDPVPLGAIFFLAREGNGDTALWRIEAGEAAARLYANALNNLAHGGEGLDAAIRITSRTLCFCLQLGELSRVGGSIRSVLEGSH